MADKFNMVRAEIDRTNLLEWANSRGMLNRGHFQDVGFTLHCLLREVFGNIMPRPFKYLGLDERRFQRWETASRNATLFGYTDASVEQLSESMRRFACPLQIAALPPERIYAKEMPNDFYEGERLRFDITVRPIVRLVKIIEIESNVRDGNRERKREIKEMDAFIADSNREHKREDVYIKWLTTKMESNGSVIIESMRMESYKIIPIVRKLGNKSQSGPQALMSGVLRVDDKEKFVKMLRAGVGRHKSYGSGMLFLRPFVV